MKYIFLFFLQKGDVIDVLQMNASGLWKGVAHNRLGHFKFINVEVLNERFPRRQGKWGQKYRQKPGSVPELLQRMNLPVNIHSSIIHRHVFVLTKSIYRNTFPSSC